MFVEIILFFENDEFSFGMAQMRAFPGGGRCRGGADINGIIYTLPPRRMRSSFSFKAYLYKKDVDLRNIQDILFSKKVLI